MAMPLETPSRRELLQRLALAGAGAVLPGGIAAQSAKKAGGKSGRIDVHQHMKSPAEPNTGQTRNWTPAGIVTLNPERDAVARAATSQIQLSSSIGEPAFPSRPGSAQAMARNEGEERSRATRSHAQRALPRASMARMASTGPSPQ